MLCRLTNSCAFSLSFQASVTIIPPAVVQPKPKTTNFSSEGTFEVKKELTTYQSSVFGAFLESAIDKKVDKKEEIIDPVSEEATEANSNTGESHQVCI